MLVTLHKTEAKCRRLSREINKIYDIVRKPKYNMDFKVCCELEFYCQFISEYDFDDLHDFLTTKIMPFAVKRKKNNLISYIEYAQHLCKMD